MPVQWEEPPTTAVRPGRRAGGRHAQFADALFERPGEWARVTPDFETEAAARAFAGTVERGGRKAFLLDEGDKGAFVARREGVAVWVRYIEDASDTEV